MSRTSARLLASMDQLRELLLDKIAEMDVDEVDALPDKIRELLETNAARRLWISEEQFWLSDIVFNLAAFGLGCLSETINERIQS